IQRAFGFDAAVFEQDDVISAAQEWAAVGHHEASLTRLSKNPFPELAFGLHIQRAGEVVEDKQFWFTDEHARGCRSLHLPTRKFDSACTDHRFQVVIEFFEIAIHYSKFC